MLSVGAIRCEDRFCASKKRWDEGRWVEGDSAWWLLRLAVEKPWSMPGGPFCCFLTQTGLKKKRSFHFLGAPFLTFRQLSVWRSTLWSEGPDYWTLANEWVWSRSWTCKRHVEEAVAQVPGLTHSRSGNTKKGMTSLNKPLANTFTVKAIPTSDFWSDTFPCRGAKAYHSLS